MTEHALHGGRNTEALRSLVHHGNITDDHIAIGAAFDALRQASPQFLSRLLLNVRATKVV